MSWVLVTGAGGQLGKSLEDLSSEYPDLKFLFLGKASLDITSRDKVLETFRDFHPDYCINCAAYTQVEQAEKTPEPAYAVNVEGVRNLVEACKRYGTILIHISTDYVFDGEKEGGYCPEDTPNPINVYGRTKYLGEQVIRQGMERYFIIRTSWLYSRKYGPNFYLTILQKAKSSEKLLVTDAQKGCPTDAANLARHIMSLIGEGNAAYGISHFTDGEAMSWFGFAERILRENGILEEGILNKGNHATIARRPAGSILL
jgi:dTDP-4-dehydrorhamnose reductase